MHSSSVGAQNLCFTIASFGMDILFFYCISLGPELFAMYQMVVSPTKNQCIGVPILNHYTVSSNIKRFVKPTGYCDCFDMLFLSYNLLRGESCEIFQCYELTPVRWQGHMAMFNDPVNWRGALVTARSCS